MMDQLKTRWTNLCAIYTPDEDFVLHQWRLLEKAYTTPNRFYHNLTHLHTIFTDLDQYDLPIENKHLLEFAIWFHDVIYDAVVSDNEEQSAIAAKDFLVHLLLSKEEIQHCFELIVSTQRHQAISTFSKRDNECLIDLDLGVLAWDWDEYEAYTH